MQVHCTIIAASYIVENRLRFFNLLADTSRDNSNNKQLKTSLAYLRRWKTNATNSTLTLRINGTGNGGPSAACQRSLPIHLRCYLTLGFLQTFFFRCSGMWYLWPAPIFKGKTSSPTSSKRYSSVKIPPPRNGKGLISQGQDTHTVCQKDTVKITSNQIHTRGYWMCFIGIDPHRITFQPKTSAP